MTDSLPHSLSRPKRHNRWLTLIAAFKLAQALLFAAIGVGALKLLHKDVDDVLEHFANHLRFNQEVGLVKFLLEKAALVDDRMLKRIVEAFFIYAGLDLIEGTGLYLEKTWAEYLTLAITASFLPLEVFEVFRRLTILRVGLLVANTLVFFYLLRLVAERAKRLRATEKNEPDA